MSEISDTLIKVKRNLSFFLQNKTSQTLNICQSERDDGRNNLEVGVCWY